MDFGPFGLPKRATSGIMQGTGHRKRRGRQWQVMADETPMRFWPWP